MSLMKTLAKVAVGVAVAKGVSAVVANKQGGSHQRGGGNVFGGQHSRNQGSPMDAISDMLSGGRRSGGQNAGLGGLMEQLSGGSSRGGHSGGLSDMLSGLTGGGASSQQSGGGLGGLLGALGAAGIVGGVASAAKSKSSSPFGDLLNQSIATQAEPEIEPSAEQETVAALMLRAMIQAAKADGQIDGNEEARIFGNLGDDVTQEELAFVQAEVRAPMDIAGLAQSTPNGLEQQVYLISAMAIDLDNQDEAVYLDQLARALGLNETAVNAIHEHIGIPSLYA